jgi:hypothetical protein
MPRFFYNSLCLITLACALFLSPSRLPAATHTLTDTNESTLRAAIAQASPGDTIILDFTRPVVWSEILTNPIYEGEVVVGESYQTNFYTNVFTTIPLTNGPIVIDKDLTIQGWGQHGDGNFGIIPGGTNYPSIDGSFVWQIFDVSNVNLTLQNLTLMNGYTLDYGAAIYNHGNLILKDCVLFANRAENPTNAPPRDTSGGAIYNLGTVMVDRCGFTNNFASASGGAICNKGTAAIYNSSFQGGEALWQGGAIANFGTLTLTNSILTGNNSIGSGGALGNASNAVALVLDCTFTANINKYSGGGAIMNSGSLTMKRSSFVDNISNNEQGGGSSNGGGALCNVGGTANLERCQVGPANLAIQGGGILNRSISSNAPSVLILNSCSIIHNYVSRYGGAMMNWAIGGPATSYLTNCTISMNMVLNSADNLIPWTTGGLDNSAYIGSARMHLMNCTVVSNNIAAVTDTDAYGILCDVFGIPGTAQAEVTLANTILLGNSARLADNVKVAGEGKLTSLGYNVCGDITSKFTTTNSTDTRGVTLLAQLRPLEQIGPVSVHFLGHNSTLLDRGSLTEFAPCDALGYKRYFGARPDPGAVESVLKLMLAFELDPPYSSNRHNLLYLTPYTSKCIIEYSTNLSGPWIIISTNNFATLTPRGSNVFGPIRHRDFGPAGTNSPTAVFYRVKAQ